MKIDYIIVQAGGKGTRLEHLTANKPKALLPVSNLPMLFHLFRKYPDKRFVIIADYHKEVLKKYLECFADVKYIMTEANGSGTCGGIRNALDCIPEHTPFMLIWSDLILPESYAIPEKSANYAGISQTFRCRWSFENGIFTESPSVEHGVAGMFLFEEKSVIRNVPENGEFVRFLSENQIVFEETGLAGTREFGLISEYQALPAEKCRPFNRITEENGIFIKEGIDEQGKALAVRESRWYSHVRELDFHAIPEIYGTNPLRMERIHGKAVYEYTNLTTAEKKEILRKIVLSLQKLHNLETVPADKFSLYEAYYRKTMTRLHKIQNLVPFANQEYISINGRKCRNIFFFADVFMKALKDCHCENFCLIHGDCTFSNLMLKNGDEPVLIDPRGYFGFTELYGDPMYDWAKLYYSLSGNYDRFNLREFRLEIQENSVSLAIDSNQWEDMEDDFFTMTGADRKHIRLIHALIWLSLTTYAWEDYDSICGAFYNGLYHLEEVL